MKERGTTPSLFMTERLQSRECVGNMIVFVCALQIKLYHARFARMNEPISCHWMAGEYAYDIQIILLVCNDIFDTMFISQSKGGCIHATSSL